MGLPVSSVSRRAISLTRARRRSPILQRMRPRSEADIFAHGPAKAARAAWTARSMSVASPSAISAIVSPVAGFTVGWRLPDAASRHSDPIRSFPPEASSGSVRVSVGFTSTSGLRRVVVDAPTDLAAQAACLDVLNEERGRAVLLTQRAVQVFQDAEPGVQADEID